MHTETFAKAIADQTRLRLLMLLVDRAELCVCEFTQALALSQPKVSRHLAVLREAELLQDRKSGLWVYYRLHDQLPAWIREALQAFRKGTTEEALFQDDLDRLANAEKLNTSCT